MDGKHIYLKDWDWDVFVFFEARGEDAETILDFMREAGCRFPERRKEAVHLLSGEPNTGMTYSNYRNRMSVMVIGHTTSADEFQSTYDHEKGHLAMHIAQADCIDPFGEEFEYLSGEIGRQLFDKARVYMCETCRKKIGL